MTDSLIQYRYFYEAAKAGSISGAAKKMFVTQPAVSTMISSLEDELSTKLFVRTGKGIRLTPEGEVLFNSVSSAFSFLEAGEEKLREIAGLSGGILRIGASDMTLRFYLLDIIEAFRRDFPRVRLSVTNAPTPQTLHALRTGAIDICVISEPFDRADDIVSYPVKTIHDIFVASERFPLRGRRLPFDELMTYPLVMLEGTTSTRRFVDGFVKSLGFSAPEPEIELATSDLVLEFAKRGIGVGCVVDAFAREAIESGALFEVTPDRDIPPRSFCLTYLSGSQLTASASEFVRRAIGTGKSEGTSQ